MGTIKSKGSITNAEIEIIRRKKGKQRQGWSKVWCNTRKW